MSLVHGVYVYTLRMYACIIRTYANIYCMQTTCDSVSTKKREIEARAQAMKNKLTKV